MLDNKIVMIDYNMGNLRSVQKAFEKMGSDVIITNDVDIIKTASKIVLPGVGSFRDGMMHLEDMGLVDVLNQEVIENKKPFLGICLGMQLISKKSFENGETKGLGWIDAEVIKFDFKPESNKLKIPHVGWNVVDFKNENKLFNSINDKSDFYFVHSYHFKSNEENVVTSTTDYGFEFTSSVHKDNIYAFQFHPEKSQMVGLQMIKNFIEL